MATPSRRTFSVSLSPHALLAVLFLKIAFEELSCQARVSTANVKLGLGPNTDPELLLPASISGLTSPLNASDVTFYMGVGKDTEFPNEYREVFCRTAKLLCGQDAAEWYPQSQACNLIYNGLFVQSCAGNKSGEIINIGFFREKELVTGNQFKMPVMTDALPDKAFLPRALASKISFNSLQLDKILKAFGIPAQSPLAKRMTVSLNLCESPPIRDEIKSCFTSLEAMVEFAKRQLGSSLEVLSPSFALSNGTAKVLGISDSVITQCITCHSLASPFRVYFCHGVNKARVLRVELEMEKGKVRHGVALCHLDTSSWDPSHPAFTSLGSKPGEGEACHWIFERNLIWVPVT